MKKNKKTSLEKKVQKVKEQIAALEKAQIVTSETWNLWFGPIPNNKLRDDTSGNAPAREG